MRSHNGGNFVKAKRELCEAVCDWNQSKIHDFLLARNIKWISILLPRHIMGVFGSDAFVLCGR